MPDVLSCYSLIRTEKLHVLGPSHGVMVKSGGQGGFDDLEIWGDVEVFGHKQTVVSNVQHRFHTARAGGILAWPMFNCGQDGVSD